MKKIVISESLPQYKPESYVPLDNLKEMCEEIEENGNQSLELFAVSGVFEKKDGSGQRHLLTTVEARSLDEAIGAGLKKFLDNEEEGGKVSSAVSVIAHPVKTKIKE